MFGLTSKRKLNSRASIAIIRCGYSLLELMIALTLLSGLLAAGWSMLATYRDAEQRGWCLVERTQTVRAAQLWLQNDLIHIAIPESLPESMTPSRSASAARLSKAARQWTNSLASGRSAARSTNSTMLEGTSRGFRATIAPSVDPVPFFERLLAGQAGSDQAGGQSQGNRSQSAELAGGSQSRAGGLSSGLVGGLSNELTGGDSGLDAPIDKPLWPLQNVQVEYELVQSSEALVGTEVLPVFDLVRRESVDRDQLLQAQQALADPRQATERVLSIDDLYRQSDALDRSNQAVLRENYLPGLTKAEFWYCDGSQWARGWNSSSGRLPTAVALIFDFAPREKPTLTPATTTDFSVSPADKLNALDSLTQNAFSGDEPLLESTSESFELLERDVRLIVLLEQSWHAATNSISAASSNPNSGVGGLP